MLKYDITTSEAYNIMNAQKITVLLRILLLDKNAF